MTSKQKKSEPETPKVATRVKPTVEKKILSKTPIPEVSLDGGAADTSAPVPKPTQTSAVEAAAAALGIRTIWVKAPAPPPPPPEDPEPLSLADRKKQVIFEQFMRDQGNLHMAMGKLDDDVLSIMLINSQQLADLVHREPESIREARKNRERLKAEGKTINPASLAAIPFIPPAEGEREYAYSLLEVKRYLKNRMATQKRQGHGFPDAEDVHLEPVQGQVFDPFEAGFKIYDSDLPEDVPFKKPSKPSS